MPIGDSFKYLVNPTNRTFTFQFDSQIYEVPARSKKLFLKEVAEHGEFRSMGLTDPKWDKDGNLMDPGNAVIKACHCEEADSVAPVEEQAPIVLEESDKSVSEEALFVDPNKPLPGARKPDRAHSAKQEQPFNPPSKKDFSPELKSVASRAMEKKESFDAESGPEEEANASLDF